jgi:hypothetical protein
MSAPPPFYYRVEKAAGRGAKEGTKKGGQMAALFINFSY